VSLSFNSLSEYCDRVSSRDNGGSFDSPAKSLCKESTPAGEGRMRQAVEQFGANLEDRRVCQIKCIQVCESPLFSPIVN
jgi:hypothetical protein